MRMRGLCEKDSGNMAAGSLPNQPADINVNVIYILNINKEGFNGVSSIKTDIYFTLGSVWLAASSILRYIVHASAGRFGHSFR